MKMRCVKMIVALVGSAENAIQGTVNTLETTELASLENDVHIFTKMIQPRKKWTTPRKN